MDKILKFQKNLNDHCKTFFDKSDLKKVPKNQKNVLTPFLSLISTQENFPRNDNFSRQEIFFAQPFVALDFHSLNYFFFSRNRGHK